MSVPTIFLFDIDGTLITTGGAGRRAMDRAFAEICDAPHALKDVRLGGMTDRLILRAGFSAIRTTFSETLYDAVLKRYLEYLDIELQDAPDYRVMEGVHEALLACEAYKHGALGLGTGNIEAGARRKLKNARLDSRFSFGGFGERAEVRSTLIGEGADRGAAQLGIDRKDARVVVIGDTPKDVEAAHAEGAECVAVATGGFTLDELVAAGADFSFGSLLADGAIDSIVFGNA